MVKLGRNYTLARALFGARRSLIARELLEQQRGGREDLYYWFDGRYTAFVTMARVECNFSNLSWTEKKEAARAAANEII